MLQSASSRAHPQRQFVTFPEPHFLSDALDKFLTGTVGEDLRRVLGRLPSAYETYVVGGVVRDLLLRQMRMIEKPAGDIDLVIKGATDKLELQSLFLDLDFRVNRMGGIKFRIRDEGPLFDLWRIEDHVNISTSGPPYTIERLLHYFLLDIDAVVWSSSTGNLYDYGCLQAIAAGEIDLLGTLGISRSLALVQCAHILMIAHGTGFSLSERARDFVCEALQSGSREELYAVLREKHPEAVSAIRRHIQELLAYVPAETR
jgi:hypothetical protein